jgi:hypothetical protein
MIYTYALKNYRWVGFQRKKAYYRKKHVRNTLSLLKIWRPNAVLICHKLTARPDYLDRWVLPDWD